MTVTVLGHSPRSAVALVDDIRVRVRRKRHAVWWICDTCGRGRHPHCLHTRALAETPSPTQENP